MAEIGHSVAYLIQCTTLHRKEQQVLQEELQVFLAFQDFVKLKDDVTKYLDRLLILRTTVISIIFSMKLDTWFLFHFRFLPLQLVCTRFLQSW